MFAIDLASFFNVEVNEVVMAYGFYHGILLCYCYDDDLSSSNSHLFVPILQFSPYKLHLSFD